jgi:hypothetical protein
MTKKKFTKQVLKIPEYTFKPAIPVLPSAKKLGPLQVCF